MLDFYLISGEQPKPEWPQQANLEFAGGMESKLFENLHRKGLIEERFGYYTDFRWSNDHIQKMYEVLCTEPFRNDTDAKAFAAILEKAIASQNGLIAYAD